MQIEFDKYVDNVYRFALSLTRNPHLAEDLTQECFLRAFRRSEQLRNPEKAKAWLFRILVNLWKDHLKTRRHVSGPSNYLNEIAEMHSPMNVAIQKEELEIVMEAMHALPHRQRSILFLHTVEQLTNREISELLEISENNVKANLSIARTTLRKKLAACHAR